ncbi:cupin domain-containing protein [Amycolatopsis panacis]|uniref:Cupin domain-containing protein n=2 Tax=Amycolatopsis panacis TaxID=2340917 RepID=A0A419HXK4_9PSEU|nr:cupin domain-containing protein [Amycolatopsis panacis]
MGDVVPGIRQGGQVRALLTPKSVGATAGFLGTLELSAGEHVAEHYHPHSDEFIFLVRGSLLVRAGEQRIELLAGDAVMVPRLRRHRLENQGSEPVLAVFHIGPLAPSPELGHVDTEPVPFPHAAPPTVGGGR